MMRFMLRARAGAAVALCALPCAWLCACSSNGETPVTSTVTPAPHTAPPPVPDAGLGYGGPLPNGPIEAVNADAGVADAGPAQSDEELVHLLDVIDTAFVDEATLMIANEGSGSYASQPTTDSRVADLARRLLRTHQAFANARATLRIPAADSPTAQAFGTQQLKAIGALRAVSGAARDKLYVTYAVANSATELGWLDRSLIGRAKEPALRDLLTTMRDDIQADLAAANALLASLQ